MLAFLLARLGVEVVILEKHADFLRDFRGDTIHPSTLDIMHELGLLDEFLSRPHQELRELAGQVGPDIVTIADFSHLPTRCRFIALMPQWDFLNFLASEGARYPGFRLMMEADVVDLIEDGGRINGVRAETKEGPVEIRATLVIGADGRHSVVREAAGLEVMNLGAPIDTAGAVALILASISWSIASVLTRKLPLPSSKVMSSGAQMLVGGVLLALTAAALGEFGDFHPWVISRGAWLSLLYLIVAGSIIGFTAYVWLIHHESPTKVGTYAYVNPVVAVVLGYFLAGERLGMRTILGTLSVLISVIVITTTRVKRPVPALAAEERG